jgi:hypothetical protein
MKEIRELLETITLRDTRHTPWATTFATATQNKVLDYTHRLSETKGYFVIHPNKKAEQEQLEQEVRRKGIDVWLRLIHQSFKATDQKAFGFVVSPVLYDMLDENRRTHHERKEVQEGVLSILLPDFNFPVFIVHGNWNYTISCYPIVKGVHAANEGRTKIADAMEQEIREPWYFTRNMVRSFPYSDDYLSYDLQAEFHGLVEWLGQAMPMHTKELMAQLRADYDNRKRISGWFRDNPLSDGSYIHQILALPKEDRFNLLYGGMFGTKTGRLSSDRPNVSNWPSSVKLPSVVFESDIDRLHYSREVVKAMPPFDIDAGDVDAFLMQSWLDNTVKPMQDKHIMDAIFNGDRSATEWAQRKGSNLQTIQAEGRVLRQSKGEEIAKEALQDIIRQLRKKLDATPVNTPEFRELQEAYNNTVKELKARTDREEMQGKQVVAVERIATQFKEVREFITGVPSVLGMSIMQVKEEIIITRRRG